MSRKERNRDDREFDTTSLKRNGAGSVLHRDYTAHFFRWSFARRFIERADNVLEVGCGVEHPLIDVILTGVAQRCESYVGVDINKVKPSGRHNVKLIGEFNFVKRWKEMATQQKKGELPKFQVAVNMEVIEHMKVEHGKEMLRGIHSLLDDDGKLLLSTPVYDGKHHAANHIHEYTVPELDGIVRKAGFEVTQRFGTFMDIKHIGKATPTDPRFTAEDIAKRGAGVDESLRDAVNKVRGALSCYFDNDAISNFFGPLYPDHSRNNLWVLTKKGK